PTETDQDTAEEDHCQRPDREITAVQALDSTGKPKAGDRSEKSPECHEKRTQHWRSDNTFVQRRAGRGARAAAPSYPCAARRRGTPCFPPGGGSRTSSGACAGPGRT